MTALVCVTGPIAAGATTCCKRLAEVTGWQTALETEVERNNPFFAPYHSDPRRYAFHNQIAFLAQSAEMHGRLVNEGTSKQVLLQDFSPFEHIGVYGHVQADQGLLTGDEFDVLQRVDALLSGAFILPGVLVYRSLPSDRLRDRVQNRARPSEQSLSIEFLEAVRKRFDEWISEWKLSPVVRIDPDVDLLADLTEVRRLVDVIRQTLGSDTSPG